jgi:glycosyltransferase involved in cell wall biosynthesis
MKIEKMKKKCVTYVPVVHDGWGWVQICVRILENLPEEVFLPVLVIPRADRPISPSVRVKEVIPRLLPMRYAGQLIRPSMIYNFKRMLSSVDRAGSIAYFWPAPPRSLIEYAKGLNIVTVREMINTYSGTVKRILDDAYSRLGLSPTHGITTDSMRRERDELSLYDYCFAPSLWVKQSLIEAGIDQSRILRSSYGWSPASFSSIKADKTRTGFRALFVGRISVRKGVPQLLAAWRKSGVDGELLLVGNVEPALERMIASYLDVPGIRLAGFDVKLEKFYKSSDVFVLPSLEEGDPLVTYEAAGCGLPLVATEMGGANIIKDGVNGLVVEAHDVDGLAHAISVLANSPELRMKLGRQAAKDAQNYTTERVGRERARLLHGVLNANLHY